MSATMPTPNRKCGKFEAHGEMAGRIAICCNRDGFAYHIWVDQNALTTAGPQNALTTAGPLYKRSLDIAQNPNRRVSKLDVNAKVNAELVDILLAEAPRLIAQLKARESASEDERLAARQAEKAAEKVRDAAPRMLAALQRVIASADAHDTMHAPDGDDVARMLEHAAAHDDARAAIAKATT